MRLRQVVAILPNRAMYRVNLASYANFSSDFQTAEQEAGKIGAPDVNALMALAFAQLGQGQLAQATETYQTIRNDQRIRRVPRDVRPRRPGQHRRSLLGRRANSRARRSRGPGVQASRLGGREVGGARLHRAPARTAARSGCGRREGADERRQRPEDPIHGGPGVCRGWRSRQSPAPHDRHGIRAAGRASGLREDRRG